MNKSISKKFTEKWWNDLLDGKSDQAGSFNPNVAVFSEWAVRAIVIEALKRE